MLKGKKYIYFHTITDERILFATMREHEFFGEVTLGTRGSKCHCVTCHSAIVSRSTSKSLCSFSAASDCKNRHSNGFTELKWFSFKMGVFGKLLLFFCVARLRQKCVRLRAARGRRRGNLELISRSSSVPFWFIIHRVILSYFFSRILKRVWHLQCLSGMAGICWSKGI